MFASRYLAREGLEGSMRLVIGRASVRHQSGAPRLARSLRPSRR
jgi:hypothetical protein